MSANREHYVAGQRPDWAHRREARRVVRAYAKADRRHGIGNIRDPLESRLILALLAVAAIGVLLMAAMGLLS